MLQCASVHASIGGVDSQAVLESRAEATFHLAG